MWYDVALNRLVSGYMPIKVNGFIYLVLKKYPRQYFLRPPTWGEMTALQGAEFSTFVDF